MCRRPARSARPAVRRWPSAVPKVAREKRAVDSTHGAPGVRLARLNRELRERRLATTNTPRHCENETERERERSNPLLPSQCPPQIRRSLPGQSSVAPHGLVHSLNPTVARGGEVSPLNTPLLAFLLTSQLHPAINRKPLNLPPSPSVCVGIGSL